MPRPINNATHSYPDIEISCLPTRREAPYTLDEDMTKLEVEPEPRALHATRTSAQTSEVVFVLFHSKGKAEEISTREPQAEVGGISEDSFERHRLHQAQTASTITRSNSSASSFSLDEREEQSLEQNSIPFILSKTVSSTYYCNDSTPTAPQNKAAWARKAMAAA